MGDIERTCERIIVLEAGGVVEQGDVAGYTTDTATLALEFDEGIEAVAAALANKGIVATTDGRALLIEEASQDDLDTIRDVIVETGALLHRLAPRTQTLSDIFRRPAS